MSLVFRDKAICSKLKPFLKKKGLFFAGIDVIGNYLTEINITSPTGMQEINRLNNVNLEKVFWSKLEKKLNNNGSSDKEKYLASHKIDSLKEIN